MRIIIFISLLIVLGDCQSQTKSDLFMPGHELGEVSNKLKEASGLVASVANPDMFWSLNDSGNDPKVFLINKQGQIVLTCTLPVENRDWEEISIGAGPDLSKIYLYVGDIGDNNGDHKEKYVYRFVEPLYKNGEKEKITVYDKLVLRLPDKKRDTEAMLVDPITHDLYLISKRENSVFVYKTSFPFGTNEAITMQKIGDLPYQLIVGGSVSFDGQEVLLKTYDQILYWKKKPGESIDDLLKRKPVLLNYEPERQGEAIAWAKDGSGFFTLSESNSTHHAHLKFYKRN